jgi:hypothetical protein
VRGLSFTTSSYKCCWPTKSSDGFNKFLNLINEQMKSIELENFGLVELDINDQNEINGGLLGWDDFVIGVAIYVTCEVIDGVARYANGERKR